MANDRSGSRRTKDGPALLAQYLDAADLSYAEFGGVVGCTKAHVCGLVTRKSSPSLALALRIETQTRRKVPSASWAPQTSRPRAA